MGLKQVEPIIHDRPLSAESLAIEPQERQHVGEESIASSPSVFRNACQTFSSGSVVNETTSTAMDRERGFILGSLPSSLGVAGEVLPSCQPAYGNSLAPGVSSNSHWDQDTESLIAQLTGKFKDTQNLLHRAQKKNAAG